MPLLVVTNATILRVFHRLEEDLSRFPYRVVFWGAAAGIDPSDYKGESCVSILSRKSFTYSVGHGLWIFL